MTDKLVVDGAETAQNLIAPLGEALLAARNAKNLTQKDAADNLRLSVKQIDALETNAFDLLPDAMITRGFIRNYARFLDVDAEPLLTSYRAHAPDKSPNTLSVQSSMNQVMLTTENQSWLKYILGSILVLLFLLSWFFYMDYMPKPATQTDMFKADAAVPAAVPAAMPLPEIALPAAERMSEVTVGADAAITTAIPVDANVTAVAVGATPPVAIDFNTLKVNAERAKQTQSLPAVQLPAGQPAMVLSKVLQSATNLDHKIAVNAVPLPVSQKVSMSFTEQTWVSVTDKSGKVIFEKMLLADSADGFDGEPPFNVVIGNAKATKLMYLGKPVDLVSSTKGNVARIALQ